MTGSFEVVGQTRIADTGFVAIDRVAVRADGETYDRTVVRHPGAVVVVPVVADGVVLMVRQFRAATGGALLEVPAGKRDQEGEPPERTAVRELEEEIGHRPGRLVKLAEFWNSPGFCDEYSHVFVALDLEMVGDGTGAPTSPEERAMTTERVALADIEALVSSRRLVDAKSIIGLLLARQHLAGAHEPLDP
ncbi:MAG TPA: NUDIX hydrolase [Acidimicrobiia bacterium]|nr:NUDIX hydrolase [Acidimicrobiia bacterium]